MNSAERHEARYQRRKAARAAKAARVRKTFDEVFTFGNLMWAGKQCCSGARWKSSTINFEAKMAGSCQEMLKQLQEGRWRSSGFHQFVTVEHGKAREINALRIRDRVVQKCLCTQLLVPAYSRSYTMDNSSSLPGKGMDFAIKRLKQQLARHYRKHGLEGGIYQYDFKSYFRSIPHDGIMQRAEKIIQDPKLLQLFGQLVREYDTIRGAEPGRGVGLGSEVSQAIALDYASPIDHYLTDGLGLAAGRYMDDGYVICESFEKLQEVDRLVHELAAELGLELHESKCRITPFRHHSFQFLKIRFTLKESGKILMKLGRRSIRQMRRKLKIFGKWLQAGLISTADVWQSWQSWREYSGRCASWRTVKNLEKAYRRAVCSM